MRRTKMCYLVATVPLSRSPTAVTGISFTIRWYPCAVTVEIWARCATSAVPRSSSRPVANLKKSSQDPWQKIVEARLSPTMRTLWTVRGTQAHSKRSISWSRFWASTASQLQTRSPASSTRSRCTARSRYLALRTRGASLEKGQRGVNFVCRCRR